jgi:hypothetical protein
MLDLNLITNYTAIKLLVEILVLADQVAAAAAAAAEAVVAFYC